MLYRCVHMLESCKDCSQVAGNRNDTQCCPAFSNSISRLISFIGSVLGFLSLSKIIT